MSTGVLRNLPEVQQGQSQGTDDKFHVEIRDLDIALRFQEGKVHTGHKRSQSQN